MPGVPSAWRVHAGQAPSGPQQARRNQTIRAGPSRRVPQAAARACRRDRPCEDRAEPDRSPGQTLPWSRTSAQTPRPGRWVKRTVNVPPGRPLSLSRKNVMALAASSLTSSSASAAAGQSARWRRRSARTARAWAERPGYVVSQAVAGRAGRARVSGCRMCASRDGADDALAGVSGWRPVRGAVMLRPSMRVGMLRWQHATARCGREATG